MDMNSHIDVVWDAHSLWETITILIYWFFYFFFKNIDSCAIW